jgi:hypothetical protein
MNVAAGQPGKTPSSKSWTDDCVKAAAKVIAVSADNGGRSSTHSCAAIRQIVDQAAASQMRQRPCILGRQAQFYFCIACDGSMKGREKKHTDVLLR